MLKIADYIPLPVSNTDWRLLKAPVSGRYLTHHTTLGVKLADDASFEQNFFQLAFSYVRDKIPNLLKFMLGFEVTKKNEDGTQAVGLFKFEVAGRHLYVPVFYKSGELKGADLLFDADQDKFLPNKENWVDSLLNSRPTELGAAAQIGNPADLAGILNSGTDMSKIYNPTMNTKLSSVVNRMDDVGRGPSWGDLTDFLKQAGLGVCQTFIHTLMQNPKLHKVAYDFYGDDLYAALEKQAAEEPVVDTTVEPDTIVTENNASLVAEHLTSEERKALLEDGVTFTSGGKEKDNTKYRIEYKVEHPLVVSPATSAEMVDVLMADGSTSEAYVLPQVYNKAGCTAVIFKSDKFKSIPVVSNSALVSITRPDGVKEFADFYKGLPKADSAKVDDSYELEYSKRKRFDNFFIDPDGRTFGPVHLEGQIDTEQGTVYRANCWTADIGTCIRTVNISRAHKRMVVMDETLFIPAESKVYSRRLNNTDNVVDSGCTSYGNPLLGTQRTLDAKIRGLYDLVKVSQTITGYSIYEEGKALVANVSKPAAIIALVKQAGVAPTVARTMLPDLGVTKEYKLTKRSQGFDPGMVFAPAQPPPPMGMNPQLGVQEQYPQAQTLNAMIPPSNGNVQNQNIMNSLTGMGQSGGLDPAAVDNIMQAAATGQRDVFDVATITEMVSKADIDTPLAKFMVDLDMALDRLGRIYFLMLFHSDKFIERYSQEDLPALEESVHDVFLNLGEIILKLKERKIESDSGSAVETDLNSLA